MIHRAPTLAMIPVVALAGCGKLFDWGPPDIEPAPTCDFTIYEPAPELTEVPPAPVCVFDSVPDPLPCNCEDYGALYGGRTPPGVFDPGPPGASAPGIPGPGEPDARFEAAPGCNPWIQYAAPWCSLHAQLSGRVEHIGGGGDDDDLTADVCPFGPSMHTVASDRRVHPQELRSYPSFGIGPDIGGAAMVQGRLHLEWQMCRQYMGGYEVPIRDVDGNPVGSTSFAEVAPQAGDYMSAVGDWVVDSFCDYPLTFGHECHYSEIHETRGMATLRSDPGDPENRYFAFVSTVLPDARRLDSTFAHPGIFFDVVVPPSSDPVRTKLVCFWEDGAQAARDCGFQQPGGRHSAFREEVTPTLVNGQMTCPIDIRCDTAQCTYGRVDWNCCSLEGAFCPCDGNRWNQIYDQDSGRACDSLLYAGVVTAEWRDPGDTWVCNNCACDDPSSAGATISAPVQGCLPPGFDPSSPDDQRAVCEAICPGKQICGGAPACQIGACGGPSGAPVAERILEQSCDPERHVVGAASPSGDYLVDLDGSTMTAFDGSESITRDIRGLAYINAGEALDVASLRVFADDFETHGRDVTEIRLANSDRVIAQRTGTSVLVPQGLGVFVLRARIDGELSGSEFQNPEAIAGSFDASTGAFYAEVHAERPKTEGRVRLDSVLQGTIINYPPTADASRTPASVECESHQGTVVRLDSTASHDPDAGDGISHVQWFRPSGEGLGNLARQPVLFPLGTNPYRLHVYDEKLGSDLTTGQVEVVDTIPPTLDLDPDLVCLWPPDHRRVRFRLGEDVEAVATDICDPNPVVSITGAVSSQPDNDQGDGNTVGDVQFGTNAVCVRRERAAPAGTRTYLVKVQARDSSNNTTTRFLRILVPRDRQSMPPGCRAAGVAIPDTAPCE